MQMFLMLVGAFLVAIALFVGLVVLWIRWKFRRFMEDLGEKIAEMAGGMGGVPPMRLELEETPEPVWADPEGVDEIARPLLAAGFAEAGCYTSFWEDMGLDILMRAFVDQGRSIYGVIYELGPVGIWLDLVTQYEDGKSITYSTCRPTGMDYPAYKTIVNLPETESRQVLERFLAERPAGPMKPVSAEQFVETFKQAHAREMDWRIERDGVTAEEIRRIAAKDGTEATPEAIEAIQGEWRSAINEFFEDGLFKRFKADTRMSISEWEEVRDRLVFVHDRLSPHDIAERFEMAYYDDDEDEEDWEDDESPRFAEAVLTAQGYAPREAFVKLNEQVPERFRHEKTGTVTAPLDADVYLEPEWLEE